MRGFDGSDGIGDSRLWHDADDLIGCRADGLEGRAVVSIDLLAIDDQGKSQRLSHVGGRGHRRAPMPWFEFGCIP